jgi:hypothetical protein
VDSSTVCILIDDLIFSLPIFRHHNDVRDDHLETAVDTKCSNQSIFRKSSNQRSVHLLGHSPFVFGANR